MFIKIFYELKLFLFLKDKSLIFNKKSKISLYKIYLNSSFKFNDKTSSKDKFSVNFVTNIP